MNDIYILLLPVSSVVFDIKQSFSLKVNYGSPAVSRLRRSVPESALEQGNLGIGRAVSSRDKIWTEVLLGISFIRQVQHAHVKMNGSVICIGWGELSLVYSHLLCGNGMLSAWWGMINRTLPRSGTAMGNTFKTCKTTFGTHALQFSVQKHNCKKEIVFP